MVVGPLNVRHPKQKNKKVISVLLYTSISDDKICFHSVEVSYCNRIRSMCLKYIERIRAETGLTSPGAKIDELRWPTALRQKYIPFLVHKEACSIKRRS